MPLIQYSNPEPEVHSRIKSGLRKNHALLEGIYSRFRTPTGSAFPDKIRLRKSPCCWREFIPDSEPRAGSAFPDKIRATEELNIVGGNLFPIPNPEPEVHSRIKSGLRKNRVLLEGIYSRFRTRAGSAFPDKIRLRKNHVLLEGIYSRFRTSNRKCIPG
jgi:hypothetical protein